MKEKNYIKLEFPSKSSNEGFARAAAAAFALQLDPTMEELGDLRTAVSEAVTNAIVHAYPDSIGKIAMRMRILDGNTVEITVRDWGCGIEDVERAMTPLYTSGGEERSGMVAKAASMRGNYVYVLPNDTMYKRVSTPSSVREMMQVPGFLSIHFSGNMGVIKTRPGYASSIAYNIDNSHINEILGTIAGDDTIFIVIKQGVTKDEVIDALSEVVPNMR